MLWVTFQQVVIVCMTFQQPIITELALSRSCLQDWFSTGHDYKYRLSIGYDIMSALKQAMILWLF